MAPNPLGRACRTRRAVERREPSRYTRRNSSSRASRPSGSVGGIQALTGNGQPMPPLRPTTLERAASAWCAHAGPKPVHPKARPLLWLKGAFHSRPLRRRTGTLYHRAPAPATPLRHAEPFATRTRLWPGRCGQSVGNAMVYPHLSGMTCAKTHRVRAVGSRRRHSYPRRGPSYPQSSPHLWITGQARLYRALPLLRAGRKRQRPGRTPRRSAPTYPQRCHTVDRPGVGVNSGYARRHR